MQTSTQQLRVSSRHDFGKMSDSALAPLPRPRPANERKQTVGKLSNASPLIRSQKPYNRSLKSHPHQLKWRSMRASHNKHVRLVCWQNGKPKGGFPLACTATAPRNICPDFFYFFNVTYLRYSRSLCLPLAISFWESIPAPPLRNQLVEAKQDEIRLKESISHTLTEKKG